MIILTRLGCGLPIALNPDLIERAEHTPDTVITLVDGHKLVVEEPLSQIVEMVRTWRASVAAEAITLARVAEAGPHTSHLHSVADDAAAAVLSEQTAHSSSLGRVLRLPSREV